MSKYRFKTKEEFIRDWKWYEDSETPYGWCGEMNHYMGHDVPEELNELCDDARYIIVDGWVFSPYDYVLKKGSFNYTGDKLMEVSKGGYMKSALLAINIVILFVSFVAFIAVAVVMPNPSVTAIRFVSILFITALVGFLGTIAED